MLLFQRTELFKNQYLRINGARAEHLTGVLGVKPGAMVRVGQWQGNIGTAQVVEIEKHSVLLEVVSLDIMPERPLTDLVVALPRPQTLKKVLETSSAMGVRRIMLIQSARVEKSYFSSSVLRESSLSFHLQLGLEQGVSTIPPVVTLYHNFRRFIEQEFSPEDVASDRLLLAEPNASRALCQLGLEKSLDGQQPLLLAIGPEGGWLDYEIRSFEQRGFIPFNMGSRILRVENAVCSLLGQIDLLRRMTWGCS